MMGGFKDLIGNVITQREKSLKNRCEGEVSRPYRKWRGFKDLIGNVITQWKKSLKTDVKESVFY